KGRLLRSVRCALVHDPLQVHEHLRPGVVYEQAVVRIHQIGSAVRGGDADGMPEYRSITGPTACGRQCSAGDVPDLFELVHLDAGGETDLRQLRHEVIGLRLGIEVLHVGALKPQDIVEVFLELAGRRRRRVTVETADDPGTGDPRADSYSTAQCL